MTHIAKVYYMTSLDGIDNDFYTSIRGPKKVIISRYLELKTYFGETTLEKLLESLEPPRETPKT